MDNRSCQERGDDSPAPQNSAVAALVPPACSLSSHTTLHGNLRPPNPEVDCTVDERVKLCIGPVPLNSNALDSLEDLSCGRRERS